MDRYAGSIVNAWLALEDVDVDLGPVQVLSAPPPRYRTLQTPGLTRADLRLDGDREFLRVAEIDAFLEKHHKRVLTATMRRGDILLFDQYAYHRGLPNVTPNRTRWSLDFRFQRADERTLRVEQGFLLDGSDTSLKSANDWVSAVPSLRLSEARAKSGNMLLGGHAFAREYVHAAELPGAVGMKRARDPKSTRSLPEIQKAELELARETGVRKVRSAALVVDGVRTVAHD